MPTAATKTASPQRRRFTVEEYHRMAQADIIDSEDRVELLDGHIYNISPIGSAHASCVDRLTRLFVLKAHEQATVRVQNPIRIDRNSEPEPDLALVHPDDEAYKGRPPRPNEVLLLVEVAGESLPYDRDVKLPLYARAQIPEVWIVALEEEQIHVYRQPKETHYAEHTTRERGEALTFSALPDLNSIRGTAVFGE